MRVEQLKEFIDSESGLQLKLVDYTLRNGHVRDVEQQLERSRSINRVRICVIDRRRGQSL